VKILQILKNKDDTLSSRRCLGVPLALIGMVGKIILFTIGLKNIEMINLAQLNGMCNDSIIAGCALLGVTAIDHFKKD